MERGLIWLPLLGIFIWLAWAGWNEYQKVQAYEAWAANFDRSKYDIRAMLGQKGSLLTWGRPTRQGPVDLSTLSLEMVAAIALHINGQPLAPGTPLPGRGQAEIVLTSGQGEHYRIPFIDSAMAQQWEKALQESLLALKSASS